MNRRQKSPPPRLKNPAYRPAFEKLDEALAENTPCNNYEKIQLMRLALFGDVAKLQASGRVVIPK
jgi:hypothetical protein